MNGVRQLSFLQLQLTFLDKLQKLIVLEDRKLWWDFGPFLEDSAFQLYITVRHQLTHNLLALDLVKRVSTGSIGMAVPMPDFLHASHYLEAGDLSDDCFAKSDNGVRILTK